MIWKAETLVIPYKKVKVKQGKFDDSYNLYLAWLYFLRRSATIIATFVRPGKTHVAESGDHG